MSHTEEIEFQKRYTRVTWNMFTYSYECRKCGAIVGSNSTLLHDQFHNNAVQDIKNELIKLGRRNGSART